MCPGPTWPVSTGGGSWQTHEEKYAGLYAGWRVVLHSTLKMSQPAYQLRRAKIRHNQEKSALLKLATSDGCCTAVKNWALLHHMGSCVWHKRKKIKEGSQSRQSEKGGKNPESLGFLSVKRKGVEASSLLPQSNSWDQCNIQHKAHWGLGGRGGRVLLCSESTPVLQGSHHIVFTIVCGWGKKKKKKRREQRRERKPVSLCRKDSAGKWSCDYLSSPAKQDFSPLTWSNISSTACLCSLTSEAHTSVLLMPAHSDSRASPDDESWRQTGFHEYWCGG